MKKLALSCLAFALAWVWGGSTAQATITLTLKTSASTVALGGTLTLTATVSGTTNTGLTWSVNGVTNGNSSTGTLTGSGLTRTYTAPPVNCPNPNPVTFKIVSEADSAISATATATVTDTIAVTLSPTSESLALEWHASVHRHHQPHHQHRPELVREWSSEWQLHARHADRAPGPDVHLHGAGGRCPQPQPGGHQGGERSGPSKYKTASVTVTDTIAVTLSPASESLALGGTQVFTATISGTTNTALNWYVNGVLNGNAAQGTLTACTPGAPDVHLHGAAGRCPQPQPGGH